MVGKAGAAAIGIVGGAAALFGTLWGVGAIPAKWIPQPPWIASRAREEAIARAQAAAEESGVPPALTLTLPPWSQNGAALYSGGIARRDATPGVGSTAYSSGRFMAAKAAPGGSGTQFNYSQQAGQQQDRPGMTPVLGTLGRIGANAGRGGTSGATGFSAARFQ